jgi:hypothetical protein
LNRRIGIDVGGVIIDGLTNDNTDTSFRGDNFMRTSSVTGAFTAVKQIVERYGATNVFIVSKCGPVIENKTRLWLPGNGFYEQTGFSPDNLRFCLDRAGKAPIVKELEITDFIDDKEEVLGYMDGIVKRRFLFGSQRTAPRNPESLIIVNGWSEALSHLL